MFGYPSDDTTRRERRPRAHVRVGSEAGRLRHRHALPAAGHAAPARPVGREDDRVLDELLEYADAVKDKYLGELAPPRSACGRTQRAAREGQLLELPGRQLLGHRRPERAVTIEVAGRPRDQGSSSAGATTRSSTTCRASSARSTTRRSSTTCRTRCRTLRELQIPKTLLELEGNHLFNFDPENPQLGQRREEGPAAGPAAPGRATGSRRTPNGNFRFVYSGVDAQAGQNVNAIIIELPLRFSPTSPAERPHRQRLGRELGAEGRRTRSRRSPTTRSGSSIRGRCSTPSGSTTS